MYTVEALINTTGQLNVNTFVEWSAGQVRFVDDAFIQYYHDHPDAFSVLSGPSLYIPGKSVNKTGLAVPTVGAIASAYIDFNLTGEAASTITIDGVVYTEADTADLPNGVWTNGASAADSAASLIAAINGDTRATVPFTAVADVSGAGVWLIWDNIGAAGNVTITTTSAGAITVQDSTGGADVAEKKHINLTHTVNTQELLSGGFDIPLPFTPTGFHVAAFSAAGAPVYFTDTVEIIATPARLRFTTAGATNLADTDVVMVTAFD